MIASAHEFKFKKPPGFADAIHLIDTELEQQYPIDGSTQDV